MGSLFSRSSALPEAPEAQDRATYEVAALPDIDGFLEGAQPAPLARVLVWKSGLHASASCVQLHAGRRVCSPEEPALPGVEPGSEALPGTYDSCQRAVA